MKTLPVRETTSADLPELLDLHARAFPDEDLRSLVRGLLGLHAGVLSLAACHGDEPVAHALFTRFDVVDGDSTAAAALLGPLAVSPSWQRQGLGGRLIAEGVKRLEEEGVHVVFVLGDPAYYARQGFLPEGRVAPPYELPPEWDGVWQSRALAGGEGALTEGICDLPSIWMERSLWLP